MIGAAGRYRHWDGSARRRIGAASVYALLAVVATADAGCSLWTRDNPMYCDKVEDCVHPNHPGWVCDMKKHRCGDMDAGMDSGGGGARGTGGAAGTGGSAAGGVGGVDAGMDVAIDALADRAGPDVPLVCAPTCGNPTPICQSATCRGCQMGDTCPAATPMCEASTGRCVVCTKHGDCSGATPICGSSSGTCVACTTSDECSARADGKPVCKPGPCVECNGSGDCPTAAKPICDMNACAACATNQQCKDKNPTRPACVMTAGATMGTCVECTQHADCTTATKPICVENKCESCSSDAQCVAKSGPDPGVCMIHTDKHCATSAEVLYVRPASGCDDTASGMGLVGAPFCMPQRAISGLTSTRNVIVMRGTMLPIVNWTYSGTGSLTVIGQEGAKIGPAAGVGILITSGDVYIRGLTVTGMTDAGISVSGAMTTVRLNRMTVFGNAGGLVVNGAGFEVNNSVFSDNNAATMPVSFGGVYLKSASGRPSVFRYNTVTGNMARGLVCDGPYPIVGVQIANNMVAQVDLCSFSGTDSLVGGTTTIPLDFDTRPYRLMISSPCRNKGGTTDYPPDDIDGNPRPYGTGVDCGAHELQQ